MLDNRIFKRSITLHLGLAFIGQVLRRRLKNPTGRIVKTDLHMCVSRATLLGLLHRPVTQNIHHILVARDQTSSRQSKIQRRPTLLQPRYNICTFATLVPNAKFAAFLDCALSCLANLTATLGWSDSRAGLPPKEPVPQMLRILCEIVVAFHCSKGPSAAVSVMGLSITRHVLLILNHVIAELQNSKVKGWELCFLDYTDEQNVSRNLVALWASRDVVLKAAALQLFNALATSPRIAIEIVQSILENA